MQPRFGLQIQSHLNAQRLLAAPLRSLSFGVRHDKAQPFAIVTPLLNGLTPTQVQQVPTHRNPQAHFEVDAAAPSEFPVDSRTIDCISSIVTGPIGNQCDQVPIGLASLVRLEQHCYRQAEVPRARHRLRSPPRGSCARTFRQHCTVRRLVLARELPKALRNGRLQTPSPECSGHRRKPE